LYDSIKEQHKGSLKNFYVAKFAHHWLEIVRKRKKQRENNSLFSI